MPNVRSGCPLADHDEVADGSLVAQELPQEQLEHSSSRLGVRRTELKLVREPPPNGGIEQVWMVGRAQKHGLITERVNVLKETDDDTLQLAKLMVIVTQLGHRIQFVEKQNTRPTLCMLEEHSQVLCGTPKERRDQ